MDRIETHRVDGGWAVADRGMWLEGLYDSDETARHAATLSDELLHRLRHICWVDGEDRPITMADLDEARRGTQ